MKPATICSTMCVLRGMRRRCISGPLLGPALPHFRRPRATHTVSAAYFPRVGGHLLGRRCRNGRTSGPSSPFGAPESRDQVGSRPGVWPLCCAVCGALLWPETGVWLPRVERCQRNRCPQTSEPRASSHFPLERSGVLNLHPPFSETSNTTLVDTRRMNWGGLSMPQKIARHQRVNMS